MQEKTGQYPPPDVVWLQPQDNADQGDDPKEEERIGPGGEGEITDNVGVQNVLHQNSTLLLWEHTPRSPPDTEATSSRVQ